ncbi:MAG: class E sortase, partial [Solirubrobacterales bacterium]
MSDIPLTTRTPHRLRFFSRAAGPAAPWRGRALRALALALVLAGSLALIDAAVTLLWQEPFSALYARLRQDHLSGALQKEERAAPTPLEQRALVGLSDERARIAFLAGELRRRAGEGSPVARIIIPRIGASFVVVKGTSTSDLESGPGIYSETAFPGVAGTTAIAGHRTTYLAPFRRIDELHAGSRILLNMPYAHFTYTVVGKSVVAPTDVRAAVGYIGYSRLVLSACTPLFSAAKRLLVFARLESTVPVGAGRLPLASPGHRAPAAEAAAARPIVEPASPPPASPRPPLPAVLEPLDPDLLSPLAYQRHPRRPLDHLADPADSDAAGATDRPLHAREIASQLGVADSD